MTGTKSKLRSLFLTTLMVLSVFAGTVAFAGTAAAANQPSVVSATEYSSNGDIEIAFDRGVQDATDQDPNFDVNDFDIYVDDQVYTGPAELTMQDGDASDGNLTIRVSATQDITPNQNVTVDIIPDVEADTGADTTLDVNESVDVTSQDIEENAPAADSYDSRSQALTVYEGEVIALWANEGGNADEGVVVKQIDGSTKLDSSTGTNSKVVAYNTSGLTTGESYSVTYTSSDGNASQRRYFNVSDLQLEASAADTNISDDDDLEVDVSAIRSGKVTAVLNDGDGDEVDTKVATLAGAPPSVTVNFGTQNADDGPYTVNVIDNQTGNNVTTSEITVSEAASGKADLRSSIVTDHSGDVVNIPVSLSNTERATVVVGSASEDNYVANLSVKDGDGDGEVVVQFNTYTAGTGAAGSASGVFSVEDSDDKLIESHENKSAGLFNPATASDDTLDASDYNLAVYAGDNADAQAVTSDSADDVGTISLLEPSVDETTLHVLPNGRKGDVGDLEELNENIDNENITQSGDVAAKDIIVAKVDASGLEGVFENEVSGAADNYTEALQNQNQETTAAGNLWFNVTQTNPAANQNDLELSVNMTTTSVIEDPNNDTYYILYDTGPAEGERTDDPTTHMADGGDVSPSDGDQFDVSFTVNDEIYDGEDDNDDVAGDDITYEDVDGDLMTNADTDNDGSTDEITVRAASGQNVSGTTNIAPGSEVTVRVQSSDDNSPFLKPLTAIVQPDGTYTATGDFSDTTAGTNFTVQSKRSSDSTQVSDEVDGQVTSAPTASVTFDDQESDGDSVTVASVTLSDGGYVAIHENNASGDVIGASEYLEAGTHSDVSITLDSTLSEDTTLVAMPHQDTDGDQTYDFPDDDGPYTSNGTAVTDSAAITLADMGEETTTTEGEETTTTEGEETTTTEGEETTTTEGETTTAPGTETTTTTGPGFGVAVSLIALIGAALLALRREN
ncbi:BGTF surface domain-containing protein [Haloarculaceae archaeon H-GB2-1]|nr:surface glycoprotein [Haloarculaceae archaeon H-GB1-1]MEA5385768.1 BGTF surface domain-containing protein [Haloarculaceae archaeon H-GB11]MEA5407272.1 BGTF surface domain-containing protein [Haloarculaceae archaeon H-GB2-1]